MSPRKNRLRKISNPDSLSRTGRWAVVAGLNLLFCLGTPLLIPHLGIGVISWSVIVVALSSWFFGAWGAAASVLVTSAASAVFASMYISLSWEAAQVGGYLIGAISLLIISIVTVRLRSALGLQGRTAARLRSREHDLTLLNRLSRDVIAQQDFDSLLARIIEDMTKLLEADACFITRWDEKTGSTIPLKGPAIRGQDFESLELPQGEKTLTLSVIEAGCVLPVEDVFNSPHISPQISIHFSAASMLGIPLMFQERKLGALIANFQSPRTFTQEEIGRAELAGRQVSILLWNAQRDLELQRRLDETLALAEIAQALRETERVGLGTALQLIVDAARELTPEGERAVIHLLDEEKQVLAPKAVSGYEKTAEPRLHFHPQEGVVGRVIVSGQGVNIEDVLTDPRFVRQDGALPDFRSLIVVPIQSGAKALGTISVQSSQVQAFTDDDGRLLGSLGTQAAIAIENTRLLESTQQSLKETDALYRINKQLIATLDPQALMQDVVELLQQNFAYAYVQIYVADPQNGDFVMRAGSGEIGRQLREQGYRLRAGEGIVGYTAETSAPFFTNNVDQIVSFARNPLLPEMKSQLAVPVQVGERILGMLDIQQIPPAQLTQRDLQLVSAVADQLALALQKANLYAELQASLHTEQAMRNSLLLNDRLATMGRLLASVSHELNNPLQAIQNALFLLQKEQGISPLGRQDLEIVLSEAERMAALIARLRATYRPLQAEDFQAVQLNDLIEDVHALLATHLRQNGISFEFFPDPALPEIPALPDQLRQVVLNLFINAVEAMPNGGRLTVSTELPAGNSEALLRVCDSGAGIDPVIMQDIFEAFVTNKERGTGLGLTIAYDIVTRHKGRIQAWNNPERGATFSVWLPIERSRER
ncbi:MAG: GAF domain-containing protein [Chloroflexota bacterium]